MSIDYDDIYTCGAITALEKQAKLYSLVGDAPWYLDNSKGIISFQNSQINFLVQYIATESYVSHTWLWADSNQETEFPKDSLSLVRNARSVLIKRGSIEAGIDQFSLMKHDDVLSYQLIVAVDSIMPASVSYACDHDEGRVHLVLQDDRIDEQPGFNAQQLREAISELACIDVDITKAINSYLLDKNYINEYAYGDNIECKLDSGESFGMSISHSKDGEAIIEFQYT